jgi:hypothetical protein
MFVRWFMESLLPLRACIATMNRPGLLPLLHWRRGPGRGGCCFTSARRFMERAPFIGRRTSLLTEIQQQHSSIVAVILCFLHAKAQRPCLLVLGNGR